MFYLPRWWVNLGIKQKLSFSRDRMVESFMFAGGVAFEPHYTNLRKWLSKVIKLILVVDDVYDVYGSLEELECFTKAIDRLVDCFSSKLLSSNIFIYMYIIIACLFKLKLGGIQME